MGLIINGQKMAKPLINGVPHNCFIDGQKIWNDKQHHNLIASYDVREHGTTNTQFLDNSGNNNHATITGLQASQWDNTNNILKFNGNGAYITTPIKQTIFNDGATLETVFKFNHRNNYNSIAGMHANGTTNSLAFAQWEANRLGFGLHLNSSTPYVYINSSNIPSDFVHMAMTYDKTMIRGYIDGILAGTLLINVNMANNNIIIGKAFEMANRYANGDMKLFNIYNSALTQTEITKNYDRFVKEKLI